MLLLPCGRAYEFFSVFVLSDVYTYGSCQSVDYSGGNYNMGVSAIFFILEEKDGGLDDPSVAGTLTHIYYIPMVMLFFFGFGLQDLISGKGWKEDLAAAVVSIGVDLAVLYIVGAFSVHTSMEDTGLGVYSANVNSLINPVIFSRFLPGLPYGEGQLEGFGYLGLGVSDTYCRNSDSCHLWRI